MSFFFWCTFGTLLVHDLRKIPASAQNYFQTCGNFLERKFKPPKNVSSKLFLMCQMVISDNKLGNCDDGSTYANV